MALVFAAGDHPDGAPTSGAWGSLGINGPYERLRQPVINSRGRQSGLETTLKCILTFTKLLLAGQSWNLRLPSTGCAAMLHCRFHAIDKNEVRSLVDLQPRQRSRDSGRAVARIDRRELRCDPGGSGTIAGPSPWPAAVRWHRGKQPGNHHDRQPDPGGWFDLRSRTEWSHARNRGRPSGRQRRCGHDRGHLAHHWHDCLVPRPGRDSIILSFFSLISRLVPGSA